MIAPSSVCPAMLSSVIGYWISTETCPGAVSAAWFLPPPHFLSGAVWTMVSTFLPYVRGSRRVRAVCSLRWGGDQAWPSAGCRLWAFATAAFGSSSSPLFLEGLQNVWKCKSIQPCFSPLAWAESSFMLASASIFGGGGGVAYISCLFQKDKHYLFFDFLLDFSLSLFFGVLVLHSPELEDHLIDGLPSVGTLCFF